MAISIHALYLFMLAFQQWFRLNPSFARSIYMFLKGLATSYFMSLRRRLTSIEGTLFTIFTNYITALSTAECPYLQLLLTLSFQLYTHPIHIYSCFYPVFPISRYSIIPHHLIPLRHPSLSSQSTQLFKSDTDTN